MCITPKLHVKVTCSFPASLLFKHSLIYYSNHGNVRHMQEIFFYLMKLTMNAYAVFLCEENNVFKIYFIYYYYFKSLQRISQS